MPRFLALCGAFMAALTVSACGGDSTGPSGVVTLRGTVVDDASASLVASASSAHGASSGRRITVTVQLHPRLTTTVGADGTFGLDGVPEGGFTLDFTSNGAKLGAVEITGATAGQEIRIAVRVTRNAVVLTAIQNGRGDDGDGDDGDEGDANRTCAISGGKVGDGINLEGHVASGDASGFEMRVNGNRVKNGAVVRVNTGAASFKCNGKPTTAECRDSVKPSAQVHVKGSLNVCDLSNALVMASEVKVQKP